MTISPTIGIVPLNSVGGWLTVLSRIDANFPTKQSVAAYTNGFGNISNNFWLGLENIYWLTNSAVNGGKTYKLRIEIQGNNGL
jgi:Fibrinogen beta and gamma chains, C-terminal globular domain